MMNPYFLVFAIVNQTTSPTTLTGVVRDEMGCPVVGANVFISTAAPRKGSGVL